MKLSPSTQRLKIFLGMTAVLVSFALLVTAVVGSMVDRFIELEMSSSMGRASDAYRGFAKQRRASLTAAARQLAETRELHDVLEAQTALPDISATIAQMREQTQASLFVIADARGMVVVDHLGGEGARSLADRPGMFDVMTGEDYYGVWEYGGQYFSVAVAPLTGNSGVAGLIALGHPIDSGAAHDLAALTSKHVIFVHGGDPIAWSMIDQPKATDLQDWLATRDVDDSETGYRGNSLSLEGVEHVASLVSLPDDDTSLIVCRPIADVIAPFLRARNEILTVGAAMTLLALFVSRELSRRMGRPIQALTAAADSMARGDLTAKVEITTNDELAVLGRSFNIMARTMESLVESAKQEARSAARAAESKSAFLATMSHEIRTPLNGILGFSEELLHSELSAAQREQAELVHGSGRDLQEIIDSVLDYSSIEAGRAEIERAPFRLHTSIQRTTEPLCMTAVDKNLEMIVTVETDVPEIVVGSKIRFEKVLQVLVDNAVRFTKQGRVAVRVAVEGATDREVLVRVFVRDTGIGIPTEHLGAVFSPFKQLEQDSNRSFGGSGLGLAIARDLAEQMGGTCGVESEPGFGSTFWFTVAFGLPPAETEEAAPESTEERQAAPLPSRDRIAWKSPARAGKRVLIVEDNPVNQKMATMLLQKAGLEFEVATNGAEAVKALSETTFDLVLMDCQMPVMDGFEATRLIRASEQPLGRHTPILALTANTMEGDRETCLAAGMDGFVGKPFTAETLILALDRWLAPASTEA